MSILPLVLLASTASAAPTADTYFQGEASYCDVHLLARAWGVTEERAGARLDTKLAAGQRAELKAAVRKGAEGVTPTGFEVCPGWEAGYTYEAAEVLARAWGLNGAEDAKVRIESKLIARDGLALREAYLAAAAAQGATPVAVQGPSSSADDAARTKFAESFTSCDAELWAKQHTVTPVEAKARVGKMLLAGKSQEAATQLAELRMKFGDDASLCQFYQLPYTYKDAQKLALIWQTDESEAKTRVEQKARSGNLDVVNELLRRKSAK